MKVWIKTHGYWCNEEELGGKLILAELSKKVMINGYCVLMPEDELEFNNTGKTSVTLVKGCLTGSNNCFFEGNPNAFFQLDNPFEVTSRDIKGQTTGSADSSEIERQVYYKKDLEILFGKSGITFDRWVKSGYMPKHFMLGGNRAWLKKDIDNFIDDQVDGK